MNFATSYSARLGLLGLLSLAAYVPAGSSATSKPAQAASASQVGSPGAVESVSRTTKAVNYRRAGGSTRMEFRGTELMPQASGEARVESKSNRIEIDARFESLEDATKFGLEYLTYVLWAVSPQGRAINLGELPVKNGASHLKAVTDMQTFAMVVTAEPYFAVTQPGNVVVLENAVGSEMLGRVENIDAQFELLARGVYSSSNTKIENAIFGVDRKASRELFEARNALRIARIALAEKYAPSSLAKAEQQLRDAEDAYRAKRDKKTVESLARDAVETAEEAWVMAVKHKAEEDAQAKAAAEKRAAEEREAKARADAEAEARRRQEADQARLQAEAAKAEAERMKQEAEQAAENAGRQKEAAEQARAAALAQQQAAEAEAEKARQAAAQAEAEKADLRARLLAQLNSIMQTRDTARGLIVNMSDVLFDTASYTLKPGAREMLAKISGILLAHSGLNLQIEGHTDSVGGDEFNQRLSERRAEAVRDFLSDQGVPAGSVTARGFGKTQPVATNDTPEGRQRNRRVEIVVSGDLIGTASTNPPAPQQ
jgi:outer membrane protein OmpA-like peptidoglycan-associated protein